MQELSETNALTGKAGQVFRELERRLTSGVYKFGETLSVLDLAEEFDVSQQPIRSALAHLRTLGYVIIVPQVGCRIVSPTRNEICDFFQMLGRMEGVMAFLAAQRHTPEQAAALLAASQKIEECTEDASGLPLGYAGLLIDWHAIIYSMADSPILSARLASFSGMSLFFLFQGAPYVRPESFLIANRQRATIQDFIMAGDAPSAELMMFSHINSKPERAGIMHDD